MTNYVTCVTPSLVTSGKTYFKVTDTVSQYTAKRFHPAKLFRSNYFSVCMVFESNLNLYDIYINVDYVFVV